MKQQYTVIATRRGKQMTMDDDKEEDIDGTQPTTRATTRTRRTTRRKEYNNAP